MWNHESLAPITPGGRRSGQQLHSCDNLRLRDPPGEGCPGLSSQLDPVNVGIRSHAF